MLGVRENSKSHQGMSRKWFSFFLIPRTMSPGTLCARKFLKHGMDFHRRFGVISSILSPWVFIMLIYNVMGGNITAAASVHGTHVTQTYTQAKFT